MTAKHPMGAIHTPLSLIANTLPYVSQSMALGAWKHLIARAETVRAV